MIFDFVNFNKFFFAVNAEERGRDVPNYGTYF